MRAAVIFGVGLLLTAIVTAAAQTADVRPGSDRWVVAERRGKIYTVATQGPAKARKELLIDLKRTKADIPRS